jgi:phosphoribosylanthranilate isomerase
VSQVTASVAVKVCGITRAQDALAAVQAGARAIGFVFYGLSPRAISPGAAYEIARQLPKEVKKVGVFVNAKRDVIEDTGRRAGLDIFQLHGDEPPEDCVGLSRRVVKAVKLATSRDLEKLEPFRGKVQAFLVDAATSELRGGTGQVADWNLARRARAYGRVILAGGLSAANVAQALRQVQPDGLDVSSGVESAPGKKDPRRLKAFFEAVKRWELDEIEARARAARESGRLAAAGESIAPAATAGPVVGEGAGFDVDDAAEPGLSDEAPST